MTIPRCIRLVIVVLAVCFLLFFGLNAQRTVAARIAQNAIQIKVDPGYNGYFRADHWTPLLGNVSNGGPGVGWELRVTSSDTKDPPAGGTSSYNCGRHSAAQQVH